MPVRLQYDKSRRTIIRRPYGSLIHHPKLVVNWHGWLTIKIWKVRRYPTLTACGFGPLEIVWPRRGYVLPESAA
jgi:hypothetical protein